MAPIGSTAPVSVVPAVATTATGTTPAATSRSIAGPSSLTVIRRCSSIGSRRTAADPSPAASAARTIEWWDSSEQ